MWSWLLGVLVVGRREVGGDEEGEGRDMRGREREGKGYGCVRWYFGNGTAGRRA